jgi:hypothetical protein
MPRFDHAYTWRGMIDTAFWNDRLAVFSFPWLREGREGGEGGLC